MSIDMNQTIAQASLDNLNDIIVPEAVGFLPLAPGWILVILLVLSLLFHFAYKAYIIIRCTTYFFHQIYLLLSAVILRILSYKCCLLSSAIIRILLVRYAYLLSNPLHFARQIESVNQKNFS